MINDITLQQIEIFLTVSEQLNLSEAAKDLFLNQSAVSRWISRLETSLDMQLFYRSNKGVELTETGEFLYEELKPMYEKLSHSLQNIRDIYDMSDEILNIGCLDSPEVIRAFKETISKFGDNENDKLMRIHLLPFKDLREELVCGNLDFVIAYKIGFGEYLDISTKPIKPLDTFLAVSKHSQLAEFDTFPTAEALRNETLYLLSIAEMKEAELRAIKLCEQIGFKPKEIKYMPNHFGLELSIKNNRGFCVSGSDMVDRFEDDIKLYKVENPPKNQYVIVAWHDKNVSKIAKEFIDTLEIDR